MPNKKHMAAATALFGTSILGLLKYFFGTWIPSFQQLVSNKVPSALCGSNSSVRCLMHQPIRNYMMDMISSAQWAVTSTVIRGTLGVRTLSLSCTSVFALVIEH